ncbi:MAG: hypothetical protein FJ272_13760, partial [Planctomycetes bacterium]|nr:hypothetical protein [Planctomycetota bacterium]
MPARHRVGWAVPTTRLGRTAVLASPAPESFVQFGIEELRRYLRRAGGSKAEPSVPEADTIICVGLDAA